MHSCHVLGVGNMFLLGMSCLWDMSIQQAGGYVGLEPRAKDASEEDIWVPSAGLPDMPSAITGPVFLSTGNWSSNAWRKECFPFSPPALYTSLFVHFAPHLRSLSNVDSLDLWFLTTFGLDQSLCSCQAVFSCGYSNSVNFWQLFPFGLEVLTALCWYSTLPDPCPHLYN